MTMPDFARGWEKEGWEVDVDGDVIRDFAVGAGKSVVAVVYSNGNLVFSQDGMCVVLPYGDPQTAKAKAEALMEGL